MFPFGSLQATSTTDDVLLFLNGHDSRNPLTLEIPLTAEKSEIDVLQFLTSHTLLPLEVAVYLSLRRQSSLSALCLLTNRCTFLAPLPFHFCQRYFTKLHENICNT